MTYKIILRKPKKRGTKMRENQEIHTAMAD